MKRKQEIIALLENLIYGDSAQKEASLEALHSYPLVIIPFDDFKLEDLVVILDEYQMNINDWEGHGKTLLRRKCEGALEEELRGVVCGSCKNSKVYALVNSVYEERFDPSSPNYKGADDDEEQY